MTTDDRRRCYALGYLQRLTLSMVHRSPTYIEGTDVATGVWCVASDIVNRIEAEDGSGCSFNVTLSGGKTLFVRIN